MKFYWCEKSRALRIGWMMEELGLPYERIRVDIRDNDAKRDADFLAASPLSKVPALVDGETKLWDSGAICLNLADTYPVADLGAAPGDPRRGASCNGSCSPTPSSNPQWSRSSPVSPSIPFAMGKVVSIR